MKSILCFFVIILLISCKEKEPDLRERLQTGLMVTIEPKGASEKDFDLPYDTIASYIYIGRLKEQFKSEVEAPFSHQGFYIQLNDVLVTPNDLVGFMPIHYHPDHIIIVDADKDSPKALLDTVYSKIYEGAGVTNPLIYNSVIDEATGKLGLKKIKYTTANNRIKQGL